MPPCKPNPHANTMEDHHQNPNLRQNQNIRQGLCKFIILVVVLVVVFVLIIVINDWLTKPYFGVVSAAVYGLNLTALPLMTTSMQFTIVIRNPNRRDGIYFDTLNAYVSYRSHPITTPVDIPAVYMKEQSSVLVSPMIGGSPVPVSRDVSNGLAVDEAYGMVGLSVIMLGRLRWKPGAIRRGHYGIFVQCDVDVMMTFKKGVSGQVPLPGAPACYVDVYPCFINV